MTVLSGQLSVSTRLMVRRYWDGCPAIGKGLGTIRIWCQAPRGRVLLRTTQHQPSTGAHLDGHQITTFRASHLTEVSSLAGGMAGRRGLKRRTREIRSVTELESLIAIPCIAE